MIVRDGKVHYAFGPPQPVALHYASALFFLPAALYGMWWLAAARAIGAPLVQGDVLTKRSRP